MKVPTLSRKPRDQFSSTRINIFAGWLFFTAWAVVCVTSVAVIVADQYSSTALSGLVAIPGIDPGCNRVIGARFLFWILLLIELFAGARLFFFPFEKGEVQATQTRAIAIERADEEQGQRRPFSRKSSTLSVVVIGILAYWGSYNLAYADADLCDAGRVSLKYWRILAVNSLRAFVPICMLGLWFTYRQSKGGQPPTSP